MDIREGAKAEGRPLPVSFDRVTHAELQKDLVQHYEVTRKQELSDVYGRLKPLEEFFGGYRAVNIGPPQLSAYAAQRQEEGVSNATINRELSVLRKMLRLAYYNKKPVRVPRFELLQESPARSGFF